MEIQFQKVLKNGRGFLILDNNNPEGNTVATSPCFAKATNGEIWIKHTGTNNVNGWVKFSSFILSALDPSNSNFRFKDVNTLQLKDVGTNGWRTIWFNNAVLQIGESES